MAQQHSDHLKESFIERVVALARQRLDAHAFKAGERLLHAYYANVPPEDILTHDAESLYGAVMALFGFARQRKPGEAKVRVYHPKPGDGGWDSPHSVIEMVNDDMPFLVDSLTAALEHEDLNVHLVVHPVLPVRRDAQGRLVEIQEEQRAGTPLESMIHIEVDRQPAAAAQALEKKLLQVLAEVRAAVADWKKMRERILEAAADLEQAPAAEAEEAAEARLFLQWLHDDNFTLLGACDFRFAEGKSKAIEIEPDSHLGILRDPGINVIDARRRLSDMPAKVVAYLKRPAPLLLNKSDRPAKVHRAAQMDVVGIKRYDSDGKVIGMHVIVGLMGAAVYTQSPVNIPILRRRLERVVARAGFRPASHDGRALQTVLEGYPRDELLQADEDQLFNTSLSILRLQERRRVAVFVRRDAFDRFFSVLIYLPRDRYDNALRLTMQTILEEQLQGEIWSWNAQLADSPLARLHVLVAIGPQSPADIDLPALEARLSEASRSWANRLQEALVTELGEERGLTLYRRWGHAFPSSYREAASPRMALFDLLQIESLKDGVGLHLYRPVEAQENEARFKIYRIGESIALSDVLPLFEHMGFRVIAEEPHALRRPGEENVWIDDFLLVAADGEPVEIEDIREGFEDAFRAIWSGEAEDDGFNRLVVTAHLAWRQVMVLRAYSKYLRQAGSTFSQAYVEKSVVANPKVAQLLVSLFETRFDPKTSTDEEAAETGIVASIEKELEAVVSADEDRILRRFLDFVQCTLRTNYFQTNADGASKPYVSMKLDSRKVQGLPLPRPMVEIFVYSPRMEGIHLRGGKVARGGIRWSDRPEDFRTEILGLMKAQMVKNSVIVPVGSKGGFVVKQPPKGGGREAFQAEGIACYQTLMRGLLDITDNYVGDQVVPPKLVVRKDGDDPYLVVAADKGTATFSDIANAISIEYGFWVGDAFASGGSQGYDHKVMGITARGAWESVKRHFREMGHDVQTEDFTVIGVGDMSGDVFGNGMLRSRHIQLVAAFDHRHIFLDPNPDAASAFEERKHLFALPRSSWADYDQGKLSAGGGVFPRDAKHIPLSKEVRERFGLTLESMTPADLIHTLLMQPVDLLWFGGIGTYVKASSESNVEVGDRANDPVRIDGKELRAKVVGEGANLAVTQLGRIEYAEAGGRLNTDAIDNSAGVDTSDHEVNIKILIDSAMAEGDLTEKRRNHLLAEMTEEVGMLVLRDNYLQTQAISLFESQAAALVDQEERFMRLLERAGRLDRAVEYLPAEDEIKRRVHSGKGLYRPEIAVTLAYGKLWLYDALLDSDLPDNPILLNELVRYFPTPLAKPEWRARMNKHRLKREIIATIVTNSIVNRVGGSLVARLVERTGTAPAEVVRAYIVVRDAFELRKVWEQIEALDNKVASDTQIAMLIEANRLIERGVGWVLGHAPKPIDIGTLKAELAPAIEAVKQQFDQVLPADARAIVAERAEAFRAQGVSEDLAERVARLIVLASANDIGRIALKANLPVEMVGRLYFLVGGRFDLGWLRAQTEQLSGATHWQTLAADAVIDDLYARQAALTADIAANAAQNKDTISVEQALETWIDRHRASIERIDQMLAELKAAGKLELAAITVASHQFRGLTES